MSQTIVPNDIYSAFILPCNPVLEGQSTGLLKGKSFGLKDVFDIAGYPTSFGSPDWLKSHPSATQTASVVSSLLDQGASLVGKTHTDELTYSILGMNAHYGTPVNPLTPNRVPGGSSSGSAVAVAGNLVDFAIGTDTGGSVRVPASFCGIYGIRPTHGSVSLDHALPLAKSFDTLGWFARDAQTLLDVGSVLFKKPAALASDFQLLIPKQALAVLSPELQKIFSDRVAQLFQPFNVQVVDLEWMQLRHFAETFRIIQAREIWQQYGQWASNYLENFGPGIKQRFLIAKEVTEEAAEQSRGERGRIQEYLNQTLQTNNLFLIPTASNVAPLLNSSFEDLEQFRKDTFQLVSIAGLGGLPQVSIPAIKVGDAGFGISLVGSKNSDMALLKFVQQHVNITAA